MQSDFIQIRQVHFFCRRAGPGGPTCSTNDNERYKYKYFLYKLKNVCIFYNCAILLQKMTNDDNQ